MKPSLVTIAVVLVLLVCQVCEFRGMQLPGSSLTNSIDTGSITRLTGLPVWNHINNYLDYLIRLIHNISTIRSEVPGFTIGRRSGRRGGGSSASTRRTSKGRTEAPAVTEQSKTNHTNPNYIKTENPVKVKNASNMGETIKYFETIGGKPNLKVYDANPDPKKSDLTIGYGFSMESKGAKNTFNKALPDRDFERVKSGEESITKDEADKLFKESLAEHVSRAKELVGQEAFNNSRENVKTAIVVAVYRGDLGKKLQL